MRGVLLEALQKKRHAELELCRRLRRILLAAREDWAQQVLVFVPVCARSKHGLVYNMSEFADEPQHAHINAAGGGCSLGPDCDGCDGRTGALPC